MSAKRKLPQKLGQPMVKQSAKVLGKPDLDESKTVVSSGGNGVKAKPNGTQETISISSDDEEAAEEDNLDNEEEQESEGEADVAMDDVEENGEEPIPEDNNDEGGEPSFGDLVKLNASEPIDVAGAFEDSANAVAYPNNLQLRIPTGASLGTVLTQALRTNDVSLLESCFHNYDVATIRATIQRLESPMAGILLQKLAERLHRRPGRAGTLMVWVQWTLVTHGGYLATQRDLIRKLSELNRVIDERAKGLQPLLSLKGKLDMLEAQMELRKSMQIQGRRADEEEEDDEVIYVEGQESEEESGAVKPQRLATNGNLEDISDSDVSEDMPMRNGVVADSDDEEDQSSEEDLIDDIAEETDADSGDEDDVDHEDQDSGEDDDESEQEAARPAKLPKTGGVFSKKR